MIEPATVPLLIPDIVWREAAKLVGENPAEIVTGVSLLGAMFYYRKLLSAGAVFGAVLGKVAFAAAVVGFLLVVGVIESLNLALVWNTAMNVLTWLSSLLGVNVPFIG